MVTLSPTGTKQSRFAAVVPSSRWIGNFRLLVMALDLIAIAAALGAAYYFKFGDVPEVLTMTGGGFSYGHATIAIAAIWLCALGFSEAWSDRVLGRAIQETRVVLTATVVAFGIVAILSYLTQFSFSRAMFMTALPLGCLLLAVGRFVGRANLRQLRRRGRALTPTIIVGDSADAAHIVDHIRHAVDAGLKPAAVCITDQSQYFGSAGLRDEFGQLPIIDLEDIPAYATAFQTSAVAIADGLTRTQVRSLAWALEDSPTELMMVPRLTDVAGPRTHMSNVDGLGLIHVQLPRYSGMNHILKRSFDVVFSAFALIISLPLLIAIAIAIKIDDGGGRVIFRQERVGRRGESFTIHKFRTMVPDAESKIQALIDANGGKALLFKAENDPRITRLGRFLRKYSLDELPQFWTVLRGSMSVVGPRPQVAREVAEYDPATHRRLLIKPGITGLWQINGRSRLSVEQSIKLDLGYVENWSLSGDLAIILKTVWVVLKPEGAAF